MGDVTLRLDRDSAPSGPADIWGRMTLCHGGYSGYCAMFPAASLASTHEMPLAAAPSPSPGVCKTSPPCKPPLWNKALSLSEPQFPPGDPRSVSMIPRLSPRPTESGDSSHAVGDKQAWRGAGTGPGAWRWPWPSWGCKPFSGSWKGLRGLPVPPASVRMSPPQGPSACSSWRRLSPSPHCCVHGDHAHGPAGPGLCACRPVLGFSLLPHWGVGPFGCQLGLSPSCPVLFLQRPAGSR